MQCKIHQKSVNNRNLIFFRFADIFGLDLSEVKTFVDEIPKVPRSAFKVGNL